MMKTYTRPILLTLSLACLSQAVHAAPLNAEGLRSLLTGQSFSLIEPGKKPVKAQADATGELKITYESTATRTYAWLIKDTGELCIQKRKATCGWLEKDPSQNAKGWNWMANQKSLGQLIFD